MPRISNLVGNMKFLAQQINSEPMLSLKERGGEDLVENNEMSFIISAVEACVASVHPGFVRARGMSKKQK